MRKVLFLVFLLSSAQTFANTILRCNIASGDLQEVRIVVNDGQMTLKELDSSGALHERAIDNKEVNSGKIKLYTRDASTIGTLTAHGKSWSYEFSSPGWRDVGTADCY